jgi:hypothetical protein
LENVGAAFGFIKKIQGISAILALFGLSLLWSLVATGVADDNFYPSLLISWDTDITAVRRYDDTWHYSDRPNYAHYYSKMGRMATVPLRSSVRFLRNVFV